MSEWWHLWGREGAKGGIRGGSAFRAIAGFGRHHTTREAHFIELAGMQPIEVKFIVTEEESRQLLDLVRKEGMRLVLVRTAD